MDFEGLFGVCRVQMARYGRPTSPQRGGRGGGGRYDRDRGGGGGRRR